MSKETWQDSKKQQELWDQFLKAWPISRVEKMTIEEYTNTEKNDSFTYWLEARLTDLGSMWGGSSLKFGIYRRKDTKPKPNNRGLIFTEKYGWYEKFGKTPDEAFAKVRELIVDIVKSVRAGNLERLDEIDQWLWPVYVWKIAFIYQDQNKKILIPVYKGSSLRAYLGIKDGNIARSALYRQIAHMHAKEMADVFELGRNVWGRSQELLGISNSSQNEAEIKGEITEDRVALNTIFFGPPGTGKTYATVSRAVEIIDPSFRPIREREGGSDKSRTAIKQRFDELHRDGKIKMVTFHQSLSYEDFVEGLKAEVDDEGRLRYQVVPGVFKALCEDAKVKTTLAAQADIRIDGKTIWKMSLGDTQGADSYIYQECKDNGYVLLGYGDGVDFSRCNTTESIIECFKASGFEYKVGNYSVTSVNIFKNRMQIGDIIVVTDGNLKFRAIGEITGDYKFVDRAGEDTYSQQRTVKWLRFYEPSMAYDRISEVRFSQMTLYQLKPKGLLLDKLQELLDSGSVKSGASSDVVPRVIIIDEINRGNISRIFGELITLIEEDKREGSGEALTVTLPYSKENFSIPKNLYIIGTMNTADRSLTGIDAALRRRFEFEEVAPEPLLLENFMAQVQLDEILRVMNERIEALLDRHHRIGHAYFYSLEEDSTIQELARIFEMKILPLLREYFLDDLGRIRIVLNDHRKQEEFQFIREKPSNAADLFGSGFDDIALAEKSYFINRSALLHVESYQQIVSGNQ